MTPAASWHQIRNALVRMFFMTSGLSKFGKVLQLIYIYILDLYNILLYLWMIFINLGSVTCHSYINPLLPRWWPFKGTHCFPAGAWHRFEWRPCRICRVPPIRADGGWRGKTIPMETPMDRRAQGWIRYRMTGYDCEDAIRMQCQKICA